MSGQKIWTHQTTGEVLTITFAFGLTNLSLLLQSGNATITGSENCNGIVSNSLSLVVGIPISLSGDGITPIQDVVIDSTAGGVVALIGIK